MKRIRTKKNKMTKLNLIPIMDAVFIFIFYLLMSAQFVDIYEIGSDVARTAASVPDNKKPLSLTLKIHPARVEVITGVPGTLYKTVKIENGELSTVLEKLKSQFPTEKTAIVIPASDLKYKELVIALDIVRPNFNSISFGE